MDWHLSVPRHADSIKRQTMELWPILVSAAVATAGALALLVAWLMLPVLARHHRLKAIPTPPKTHWLLGHPGVVERQVAVSATPCRTM